MSARWDLKAQLLGADIPQQLNDVVFEQYINPEDDFSFGNTCAARIEFATYESGPTLNNEELTFQYKDSTSTIWNNLGTFKILECKDEYDNNRIYKRNFVGYDAMIYAFNIKYDYQVTLPATPNDVLRDIANQTGIAINSLPVIYPVYVPAQPSTIPISNMPYITFIPPECTIREMIGYIAGLHGCNAVMNKNGSVSWVQYYSHHPITIDASDIYDDTPDIDAITVTSIGQIRYIANRYRSDGTTYRNEYISGTYTQGNSQLIIKNPYMAQPVVNALASIILGTSSMNVSIDTIKSFELLGYDSYTFTANGNNYTLPKMYLRIEWDGGAMATVSSFGVTGDDNTTSYTSPTESSIKKIVNVIQNSSGIAQYLQTPNTSGFNTDANGNFTHKRSNNSDTFNIYSYNNDSTFGVNYENGLITIGDDAGLTAGTSPYYHALYHETNSRYQHHLGNGNFIYSTSSTPIDMNDTVDYIDEIVDFTYKGGTGKKPRYFNVINYREYHGFSEVRPFVLDLINGHIWSKGNIIAPGQLIVSEDMPDDNANDEIVSMLDDNSSISTPTKFYWLNPIDMKLRKFNSYDATTRTSTWDVVFDFNQGGGGTSYTFGAGLSLDTSTNTVTNSGVRSIATGTTNGTISVNTNGTVADVSVYGLGSMAYKSNLTQSDVTTGLGYTPIDSADKGQINGVAELDANGLVPSSQLPSYVDDVLEYATMSSFPATGQSGKIYVDLSTNLTYRWSGSAYVEISPSLALGTTSSTAFRGDYGQTAYNHSQQTSGNPHNVTKTDVGLGNVPNVTTDNQTPTVSEATTRTNLAVGDTLAVIISKIKKFFSDLKTVAFTGDYNDLSNTPTIPTVNNGTLTIQKNGTTVRTFTANQSTNVTADIEVPLATSDLINDSGFIDDTDVRLTAIKNPNSYVGVARYYSGVSTPNFIRIKFPDAIVTKQTLLNIQIYVNVAGIFGGNIYICAMHGINDSWQGNAYCYEHLHGNVFVYASDGKYIYIDMRRVSQNYITLTIDNLTVSGNAEEVDFSETTIDSVSSLPSTYQTLTIESIEADYATTAGSATDSTKLPLSGGTMSGNLEIAPTCNIMLRTLPAYKTGIGYDPHGNGCIALWAKSSTIGLRWYAGTDMSTMSPGSMMKITPDFEVSKATGSVVGYLAGNTILHSGNISNALFSYINLDSTYSCGISFGRYDYNMVGYTYSTDTMYKSSSDSASAPIGVHVGNATYNTLIEANTYLYLKSNSRISASTTINIGSDEKVKTFTDNIESDEEKLIKLFDIINPKSYNYKYLSTDKLNIGFSAQEVERAFKELNIEPDKYSILDIQYAHMLPRGNGEEDYKYYTKYMSISYTDLHNLAILKMKNLEKRLNKLEGGIN